MPTVMLRQNDAGKLVFYVAKKDLEETVVTMQFQGPDAWGGELQLADGSRFYIEPLSEPPKLPITLKVKRL